VGECSRVVTEYEVIKELNEGLRPLMMKDIKSSSSVSFNCSQLITNGLGKSEVFNTRFGSLLEALKLSLQMRDPGPGL
jgi:hypothetical protein